MKKIRLESPELALLERLCSAFGPTGCEDEVADLITAEIADAVDDIFRDINGNLFAYVYADEAAEHQPDRADLLIAAHMDEVGFMITSIDDGGTLKFFPMGIDARVLSGRRVIVGDEVASNRVPGVICSKPIHLLSDSDRTTATPADKMYIDIGAKNREEAEKLVSVGDYGTFVPNFCAEVIDGWEDGRIVSKAIDDRVGCAAMVRAIRGLKADGVRPTRDVCFAFTVGEEGGISGATSVSYRVRPEYAVILESTAIADICDVPEYSRVAELGGGGALSIADRLTLYNREWVDEVMATAEKNGIKCQYKRYVSGGNDSGGVQRAADGVKVAALSVPTRFLHTANTIANAADYEAVSALVSALVRM